MSLVLTLVNRENAVLVSDRRLVMDDGLREDESNKAGVLVCRDARLGFAFVGLAEYAGFKTRFWLPDALSESAKPDFLMGPLLQRFRERATERFSLLKGLTRQQRRLTVVLAGYSYAEAMPRAYVWWISNFEIDESGNQLAEAQDDFVAQWWRDARKSEEPLSFVSAHGITAGIPKDSIGRLDTLVKNRKPAAALVGKAIVILREAAAAPASAGMIGLQCSTIIIPSNLETDALAEYHTAHPTAFIYMPSYVEAGVRGELTFALTDPEVQTYEATDKPVIARVPKVGRNQLCPCGSGLKYEKCHGR